MQTRPGNAPNGPAPAGPTVNPASAHPEHENDGLPIHWQRVGHEITKDLAIHSGTASHSIGPGIGLFVQGLAHGDIFAVTVALVNNHEPHKKGDTRNTAEERSFFQVGFAVDPLDGCRFVGRPSRKAIQDEDDRIGQLIYRETVDLSVGHTCSARWDKADDGTMLRVATDWTPQALVYAMSPTGDPVFQELERDPHVRPLSARWLSEAEVDPLIEALSMLPAVYRKWIENEHARIGGLEERHRAQAGENLRRCRSAADRMDGAIRLLREEERVREAFRLANRAMVTQRQWTSKGTATDLTWRPFQLGFQLLALESIVNRNHADRQVMDLLWFPTGGGKTEAYLGLTAFTMILRRLREGVRGGGVATLMRYTLRVLTVQQFQRAAALICACEMIRRERGDRLGREPFSLGLWVGGGATPNSLKEARRKSPEDGSTHKQIRDCPACGQPIDWSDDLRENRIEAHCRNTGCALGLGGALPLWTIDELVYRMRPSLVIGTVDKFAQIARQPLTRSLFGTDGANDPPDLIIQDELHLITGPLGTLTALYEIAIDELCTRGDGFRPKIIGSTATIRRARSHIRALFNRDAFQFPPPALDASNSCFAVEDRHQPGRLYVGLTTAGRSPKFSLQAAVATLLQGAVDSALPIDVRSNYWTLVEYFNSLRELGGALVLMQDDVGYSVRAYAARRNERPRLPDVIEELTSRKRSSEIPGMLKRLEMGPPSEEAIDVLLASSMISVGVDIPRLGLMLVNGQPKGIAEYIQATSRVGRGAVPGLIVTLFNNGRARDRSHYETFPIWHATLYRDVEATGVTPFASRALDKALHGVLVALIRHRVEGMLEDPDLDRDRRPDCEEMAESILSRCRDIDVNEATAVRAKVKQLLDHWEDRDVDVYWDDFGDATLLMSAEQHAAMREGGESDSDIWATPNSMREVEPGTPFVLVPGLAGESGRGDAQE